MIVPKAKAASVQKKPTVKASIQGGKNSLSDNLTASLPDSFPSNIQVGEGTVIQSERRCFARFQSERDLALTIGQRCTIDYVHFALGKSAQVTIGDYCCLTSVILLCESSIQIGSYVMMGWNTTVADSDFHPINPARRIEDAIACSPLGNKPRPPIVASPVVIKNNVWIGPNVTLLKGITIGEGAWIEPGSLVTKDIPPYAKVMGNPARVIAEVNPS